MLLMLHELVLVEELFVFFAVEEVNCEYIQFSEF